MQLKVAHTSLHNLTSATPAAAGTAINPFFTMPTPRIFGAIATSGRRVIRKTESGVERMNTTTMRILGGLDPSARRVAERAALRAGLPFEDWLREAILERTDVLAEEEGVRIADLQSRSDEHLHRGEAEGRWRGPDSGGASEVQSLLSATLDRIEQRFALNEERTALAFESIALLLERATAEARRQEQNGSGQTLEDQSPVTAVEQFPVCSPDPSSRSVSRPEAQLASTGDTHRNGKPLGEASELGAKVVQVSADDIHALHSEIDAIARALADLADGIEKIAPRPAPNVESAEMAACLEDLRREIVRHAPTAALASIEQRLNFIAARLDEEAARAPELVVEPRLLDDLARSLESFRQSLEAPAQIRESADTDDPPIKPLLAELIEKLDRLLEPEANERPIDIRKIETALEALNAKLETEGSINEKTIAKLTDNIAQRIEERATHLSGHAIAQQIAQVHRWLDAVFAGRSHDLEIPAREVLDRLQDASLVADAAQPKDTHSDLDFYLEQFRAEHANADRRMQAHLATLQSLLEQLMARLPKADPAPVSSSLEEQPQQSEVRNILRSVDLLGVEGGERADTRPAIESSLAEDESTPETALGEVFLLEPGARAPHWPKESGESAQAIGAKTNPAVTAHIAAARRAAQAALTENGAKASGAASSDDVAFSRADRAKAFYLHHRRSVLLAIALAVITASAARVVVLHPPFSLRSEPNSAASKPTSWDTPPINLPRIPSAMTPDAKPVDTTPTASIRPGPEALRPLEIERGSSDLVPAIPPDAPQSLRDAVIAGSPGAQYELAQRLLEGRGVAQNQRAAAQWFERAAVAGLAPAQFRIGMLYEKGIGVSSDRFTARRWYFQAAQSGNARAAHNLAVMYAEPPDDKPNYAEAAKWFRKAGELGVRDSQFNLGVLYARGLGVSQDLGQSWLWFSLAAAQGDADAEKKRDEVASKMDPAALAAAAEALSRFKVSEPEPAANEVVAPPGGSGMAPSGQPILPPPDRPKSEKAM